MKNNKIIFIIIFLFFFSIPSSGEEFNFKSSKISVLEKGNLIIAENGVEIVTQDNLIIEGEKSEYNKEKNFLKIFGDVKLYDKNNNIVINSENVNYSKKEELIFTEGKSTVELENRYFINSSDLNLDRNSMNFYSKNKTTVKDTEGYHFILEEFNFDIKKKFLKGINVYLKDTSNNEYSLKTIDLDLNNYNFEGENLYINFDNSLFGNKENEPRLTGKKITDNPNESTILNGSFTTCKKNKKNCPPWLLSAKKITHKKKQKRIEYRNAWLEIYKKPIIYFPYFFHPDPTVKRQSGFLAPSIINSNVSGTTIKVPYYKVVSEDKDLTFSPQLFIDKKIILQTEYRQTFKYSDLITDFALSRDENQTKSHLFYNLKRNKNNSNFEINLEKVSNDKFLKINKIESSLIDSYSELHSYIEYDNSTEDSYFNSSIEIFENLNKKSSDRFEFIYPSILYSKNLEKFDNYGQLSFSTDLFQKKYNTNQYEGSLINDLTFDSNKNISNNGFVNSYKMLLRNVNTDLENSTESENANNHQLLSTILFESKYPLQRLEQNNKSTLTPIFSARYSPNNSKNIKNLDRRISYNDVYSLDRLGKNSMVEGGLSITMGSEFVYVDSRQKEIINFSFANVFRNSKDNDLPDKSTLGNKRSDIFGLLKYKPSNLFDLEYEFSLDKNLDNSNFNLLRTNFTINNFVTSFEFLEEDNIIGNKSYITNKSKLAFDKNNFISFETSKNLDKNITDYYNLIYEYKNDCLSAALEYNKTFYNTDDLKNTENIFFKIKIIPFGQLSSPTLN